MTHIGGDRVFESEKRPLAVAAIAAQPMTPHSGSFGTTIGTP